MMRLAWSQRASGRRGRPAAAAGRRRLLVAALIVPSILLAGVGQEVLPAAADEEPLCRDLPPNHPCHDIPLPPEPPPDRPPPPDDPPPDGDPPQPPPPQDCTNPAYGWEARADQSPDSWADAREDPADWPEGSLVYARSCNRNIEERPFPDWASFPMTCWPNLVDGIIEFCTQYRVYAPGEDPEPPAPEDVAGWGWLCVEGWFDTPDVNVWPAPDQAVVVRSPTFVALEGEWPPFEEVSADEAACPPGVDVEIDRGDDDVEITVTAAGLTVTMVGEAQLLYDTGEPSDDGTIVVDCEGPGRPFDPDGDPPDEQAEAEGACTHAYTERTTPGQPWPAGLEFSWDIDVFLGDAQVATFGPLTSGTTFDRQVDEVHAVVSDVGD